MCSSLQGRTRSAGGPTVEPSIGLCSTARLRERGRARYERSYSAVAWSVTCRRQARHGQIRWRLAVVGWRFLALREVELRLGVFSDDLPICHPARPPSGEVIHV